MRIIAHSRSERVKPGTRPVRHCNPSTNRYPPPPPGRGEEPGIKLHFYPISLRSDHSISRKTQRALGTGCRDGRDEANRDKAQIRRRRHSRERQIITTNRNPVRNHVTGVHRYTSIGHTRLTCNTHTLLSVWHQLCTPAESLSNCKWRLCIMPFSSLVGWFVTSLVSLLVVGQFVYCLVFL
jgi:hypothetical protein